MLPNPSADAQTKQDQFILTAKNKKTILNVVRDKLLAKGIDYVVFRATDLDDEDYDAAVKFREPDLDEQKQGAKMQLELNRMSKPSAAHIDRRLQLDAAQAKTVMLSFIDRSELTAATKAAMSSPWSLYTWMEDYRKHGEASRIGHLNKEIRLIKLADFPSMKEYLKKMRTEFEAMEDIKVGFLQEDQFFTLVLDNLGEDNTAAKGVYRSVYKELSRINLRGNLDWEVLRSDLEAEWDLENPPQSDAAAADTTAPSLPAAKSDEIALLARELKKSKKELALLTKTVKRGRERDNKKQQFSGNCFVCGQRGHRALQCDQRADSGGKRGKSKRRRSPSAETKDLDDWSDEEEEDSRTSRKRRRRRKQESVFVAQVRPSTSTTEVRAQIAATFFSLVSLSMTLVMLWSKDALAWILKKACEPFRRVEKVSDFVFQAAARVPTLVGTCAMIIDSGATCHIINDEAMMARMKNTRGGNGEQVSMNGHLEPIQARGDLEVFISCENSGKQVKILLRDVAFCPTSEHALFSTTAYLDAHKKAHPHLTNAIVQTSNEICIESGDEQIHGVRRGNLSFFNITSHPAPRSAEMATPAVSVVAAPAGVETSGEGSTPPAAQPKIEIVSTNPWAVLADSQ
jgi:hypothetical protein